MDNILGKRIKLLREEKEISQLEFSKILNINNSTLSQYEAGNRVPSDEIKKKIAEYFNVSLDYLMGTSDVRNPYIESDLENEYKEVFDYLDLFVQEMKKRGYDYSDKSREELAELFVKLLRATDIIKDGK